MLAVIAPVHLIACVLLFGQFVFLAFIRPDGSEGGATAQGFGMWDAFARRACAWIALATALLWLAGECAAMSGQGLAACLHLPVIATVLRDTHFGRVWVGPCIAAGVLCGLGLRAGRCRAGIATGLVLSGLLLASLGATGHAAAVPESRAIQIAIYAAHLLAAGAWVGALPPLALLMVAAARGGEALGGMALDAAERFGVLGLTAVLVLFISGLVNAGRWVGPLATIPATTYGRLLIAKTVLFLGMLAIAATNRLRLTPALAGAAADPARRLGRNAWIEFGIGLIVLLLAAALSMVAPGAHMPAMPGM